MNEKAFTLLETVVYFGIIVILIPLIVILLIWTMDINIRSQTSRDLEAEGLRVLQLMVGTIRNGDSVLAPGFGSSSSTLIIDSTTYTLDNNRIKISEGGNPLVAITSDNVMVTNLLFQNVSKFNTPEAITVRFKIKNKNQEKNFYVSAALRK